MSNTIKEKIISSTTEYGGAAAGAAAGAYVGTAIAGPVGTIGGALLGTVIEKTFAWAGKEIKERVLSPSEIKRIGTVHNFAIDKINSNMLSGKQLRNDGFFHQQPDDRSTAEEILEGTFLAAQKEHEEKKLSYLANLYANINFDETISRPMANQLIRIASTLSYRQLMIISVIGKSNNGILSIPLRDTEFNGFDNFDDMSIAAEIFDLYRMSLIISSRGILDSAGFIPDLLKMNGLGELLYNHMELVNAPIDDITQTIIAFLTDTSPAPTHNSIAGAQLPQTPTWEEIDDETLAISLGEFTSHTKS